MRRRCQFSSALVALFGIVTTHCLLEIDLMNLTKEQKTGPVPVKLHDKVRLRCGKYKYPTRWVRIREKNVTFFKLGPQPYEIQNFTMLDNGNYQCRVETNEYRTCSNVVLCEAANDFSKCKTEGQIYRHLIKYGPLDRIKQAGEDLDEIRFNNLGFGYTKPLNETSRVAPMEKDIELDCGNVTSKNLTFLWFVMWKSEWFNLEEYAQSSSNSTKLMPIHRGEYQCVIVSKGSYVYHKFYVTLEGDLLPPSYVKESSMRDLGEFSHHNLNISCDIDTNSSMNITWVKSDVCPNTETKICKRQILKDPKQTGKHLNTKVLHITELSSTDEGCYTCLVSRASKTFFQSHRLSIQPAALEDELGTFSMELMVSIPCVVFLLFAVIGAAIYYSRRSRRVLKRRRFPSPQLKMAIDFKSCSTTALDVDDEEEVSQSPKICSKSDIGSIEGFDRETHVNAEYSPWEIGPENLKLSEILREHDFYTLCRAWLVDFLPERSINVVAKMSKAGTTDSDLLALVSEMEIMKSVGRHVNVLGLLGTCTRTDALFFVVEFAEHGNLRDYLRERGSSLGYEYIHESESESEEVSVHIDLVSYARQVAMGMEYLASQRCVHRDLRAKRVLIGEGGILKITDYATKRIRREDFHAVAQDNNLLSVRWMAPETLFRGIHTTEANVWSYGILLWEIMTFAETPYPLILTNDELVGRLKLGYYMENPNCCPDEIYKLMKRCWNENPAKRPRFDQLVEDLDGMLKNLSDQLQRLEFDDDQQVEYANTSEPSRKQNYDSEYADVTDAIGVKLLQPS